MSRHDALTREVEGRLNDTLEEEQFKYESAQNKIDKLQKDISDSNLNE